MRLAELLTVVIGKVAIFEYYPERALEIDSIETLYCGPHEKVPKDLLRRDVMYIYGGTCGRMDICLVRE